MQRRTFTRVAGSGMFLSSFPFLMPNKHQGMPPSDQVNIGLIGCRNRGFAVLRNHLKVPGVNVVALCDIDARVLQDKSSTLDRDFKQQPQIFGDYRKMLAHKDLDAVIIATPDHWHCLPMVHACEMGLDVYVEKPMANSIEECSIMVPAARQYDRIVQVGQQQRSSQVWNEVMSFIKGGALGKLSRTNIWANFRYGLGPERTPDGSPPSGVDYNFFLGPAPLRPFNAARFHGSWRFFWDYGGGLMTDWGVHLLDMGLWARNLKTAPNQVIAYGSQDPFVDRPRETHDTLTAIFPYDDYLIQWEHNAGKQSGPYDQPYGVAFIGEKGTLVADRSKWQVFAEWDPNTKQPMIPEVGPIKGENGHARHAANFVDCIKSRAEPNCPVEMGHAVAVSAHMANIAVRTNQHALTWDRQKESFKGAGSTSANKLVRPSYRRPWKLPKL
ncbi:MAG: Gfo/Idh/MocA family oxidoreductase [Saprospiraceae bacterium]|nr:Gfo/Idh/MocA family oxidoreductase [Saprospiraceae bacterium]